MSLSQPPSPLRPEPPWSTAWIQSRLPGKKLWRSLGAPQLSLKPALRPCLPRPDRNPRFSQTGPQVFPVLPKAPTLSPLMAPSSWSSPPISPPAHSCCGCVFPAGAQITQPRVVSRGCVSWLLHDQTGAIWRASAVSQSPLCPQGLSSRPAAHRRCSIDISGA